jgi:hypothetical protein
MDDSRSQSMAQRRSCSPSGLVVPTQSVAHFMGSKIISVPVQGLRCRSTPGFMLLPLSGAPEQLSILARSVAT